MPADCVIASLSWALTLWWVGEVLWLDARTQQGANLCERRIDEPVNRPCNVMGKDLMIYNKTARNLFCLFSLSCVSIVLFWEVHLYLDGAHVSLVSPNK